jgi:hypothetical protein
MTENLPAKPDPDRALIAEVAMDIVQEAVSHLRIMYPAAFAALGPSRQLSLRNHIHNQIMAALDTKDAYEIRARLKRRKDFRRKMHAAWDKIRNAP